MNNLGFDARQMRRAQEALSEMFAIFNDPNEKKYKQEMGASILGFMNCLQAIEVISEETLSKITKQLNFALDHNLTLNMKIDFAPFIVK